MKTTLPIPNTKTGIKATTVLIPFLVYGLAFLLSKAIAALFYQDVSSIDVNIWPLILLAFICWLFIIGAAALAFTLLTRKAAAQKLMFSSETFNQLSLWQQYVLYMAFYALLVCSAIGCLIAIC